MSKVTEARFYKDVNTDQPDEFWNYIDDEVKYGSRKNYQVVEKLGSGTFGIAFRGYRIKDNTKVTIKVLKELVTPKKNYKREIKILKILKGGPNIISLLDAVIDKETKIKSYIFDYVETMNRMEFYEQLNTTDVQYYTYEILKGLDYTHSKGIIHRDIKPHNVLIDHTQRKVRIIDWGTACFYIPRQAMGTGVGTRGYKAPENLEDYSYYDYGMDVWALGVMLANMLFRCKNFFLSKTENDYNCNSRASQLQLIKDVLGTKTYEEYMHYLEEPCYIGREIPKKEWTSFVTDKNKDLASEAAFDLLDKILVYNHVNRLTAKEAMNHPYFSAIVKEQGKHSSTEKPNPEHVDMPTNKESSEQDNPRTVLPTETTKGEQFTQGIEGSKSVPCDNTETAMDVPNPETGENLLNELAEENDLKESTHKCGTQEVKEVLNNNMHLSKGEGKAVALEKKASINLCDDAQGQIAEKMDVS